MKVLSIPSTLGLKKANKRIRRRKILNVRAFKCRLGCNKNFGSYSARKYHEDFLHPRTLFACPMILCTKRATSEAEIQKHMIDHQSFKALLEEKLFS